MRRLVFQKWCNEVTSGIHTHPDREHVSKELSHHLEDKYQALVAQGVAPKEATEKAIADMGDPTELTLQLAAAHRPLWGKVYAATQWITAALLLFTLVIYGLHVVHTKYIAPPYEPFDADEVKQLGGEEYLLQTYDPDCAATSDGYYLRISEASLWLVEYTDSAGVLQQTHYCNFQLKTFNMLPWAPEPDFAGWFWAVDDLGNYYYSEHEDSMDQEPSIGVSDYHTGMFTYVHDLWLRPYVSTEASWIELHYDRSGRDIVLRIDLTGGEVS